MGVVDIASLEAPLVEIEIFSTSDFLKSKYTWLSRPTSKS